ncbi:hypothetical protein TWF225_003000 [Orbilia oligospora]|nr:hypothetical protein TWF225_003000 [Orbilia oligospora]KAF3267958.1 hypothetical protein TWF217_011678 [Orbilia oligospora]KAF3269688.1 hypothetical protein TWF128_005876 [Orbilia oligospora]
MHFQIACAFAVFQIPVALSHVLVTNAFGNADPSAKTYGIGLLENTNRQNGARVNNQRDVTVFSDPTMAPNGSGKAKKAGDKWYCKKCPIYDQECKHCKGVTDCKKCFIGYDPNCSACRKRNIAGCGRTYYVGSAKYYITDSPELRGTDPGFPSYNTARLNTTSWLEWMVDRNLVAKVTAGGWVNVTMSQQNTDGGGPYMCQLDETGTGENFKPLDIVGKDCAGRYGANLCKNQDWYVGAILPKDLNCKGTTIGEKKTDVLEKICMLKCYNDAPNGPFGGCIPIQQVEGKGAMFPPLGKQDFCENGPWPGSPHSDKFLRFLAGNDNLKQADMDYLAKEAGVKRTFH